MTLDRLEIICHMHTHSYKQCQGQHNKGGKTTRTHTKHIEIIKPLHFNMSIRLLMFQIFKSNIWSLIYCKFILSQLIFNDIMQVFMENVFSDKLQMNLHILIYNMLCTNQIICYSNKGIQSLTTFLFFEISIKSHCTIHNILGIFGQLYSLTY